MRHAYLTGYTDPFVMKSKCTTGLLIQPWTEHYCNELIRRYYNIIGIDNGCFSEIGRSRFTRERYQRLIENCLVMWGYNRIHFATVRDVPMNWSATLDLFHTEKLHVNGVRRAMCLQDGCSIETIPWSDFQVMFIGGSTEWKISEETRAIVKHGLSVGKTAHMGRVNSKHRATIAQSFGCLTSDGTYLLHEHVKGNVYNAANEVRQWSLPTM